VIDSKPIEALREALDKEYVAYRDLLDAMEAHLIALRGQDPLAIEDALQRNLECVESARKIGAERRESTRRLLERAGLEADRGIDALLEGIADGAAGPLREKLDGISRLGRDIRFINDRNRRLAEYGLDLLRGDFRILAELVEELGDQPGEDGTRGKLLSMRA